MVSQDRDVRTGTPVWDAYRRPRIAVAPLARDLTTDVLIIGAGISGAMMAEAMAGKGLHVVVVDKRRPLAGATSASTALLQCEIDTPLTHLAEKRGKAAAIAAWRRSRLGVESLAAKIAQLDIDCAMHRKDTLYISGDLLDAKKLAAEGEMRNLIGLPCTSISRSDLKNNYGLRGGAALLSTGNIVCNPVQLAAGFLHEAARNGAEIYAPVELVDRDIQKNHAVFYTGDGLAIRARYAIYATGFEIPDDVRTRKHKIISTWAVATGKINRLPRNLPMLWQASDPYVYLRTTDDGRIIFGGEDEEFSNAAARDALIPAKERALRKKLAALLPDIEFDIEYSWTGSFGASSDGLPTIGRIPGVPHCYAVMAYGGNGITFSRIAAEIISADIFGHKDPDADLFAFKT